MFNSAYAWARSLYFRLFDNPLIRRIITNSGYLFGATGISAVMSMLQGILAARLLGPAMFGVLGSITTFTSTINRFASFRMDELVVRYVGHYQEHGDSGRAAAVFKGASLLEMGGSLLAFVLVWFLAPVGARFFAHDVSLAIWFRVYGSIVLANLISESATGLLQIFDRFRTIAYVTAVQSVLTLVLIAAAYFNNAGLIAIVLAYMAGKTAGALAFTGAALWQARQSWGAGWWRSPLSLLGNEKRSLLTFAFSTNISGTISLVSKDSEVLWVAGFLGTTQAGYYKLALALSNLLQLPVSPLPKATYPELAREIARRNWENVRYVLRQGSRLSALYSVSTTTVLVLFGGWIISAIYGAEYLPTYPALVVLLVGFTFVNIFYWNRVALLSLGRPVFPTIVNFIGMALKVSAILVFVPQFGYMAFAFLLAGYYIFTVGIAAARVFLDLRTRMASTVVA
jgi:O-antigen/teichoic acid export membrane protein